MSLTFCKPLHLILNKNLELEEVCKRCNDVGSGGNPPKEKKKKKKESKYRDNRQ